MSSPWDEFSADDRRQLLQISKEILSNQLSTVEGAYGLWSIILNYNFSNSKDLLLLQGLVDECSSSERGEAHLYSAEMLTKKDNSLTDAVESYSPFIRDIAAKIVDELALV
jgi:hypothetical protein